MLHSRATQLPFKYYPPNTPDSVWWKDVAELYICEQCNCKSNGSIVHYLACPLVSESIRRDVKDDHADDPAFNADYWLVAAEPNESPLGEYITEMMKHEPQKLMENMQNLIDIIADENDKRSAKYADNSSGDPETL